MQSEYKTLWSKVQELIKKREENVNFEEDPLRGVCCEKGLDFSRADVLPSVCVRNAALDLCMRRALPQ